MQKNRFKILLLAMKSDFYTKFLPDFWRFSAKGMNAFGGTTEINILQFQPTWPHQVFLNLYGR